MQKAEKISTELVEWIRMNPVSTELDSAKLLCKGYNLLVENGLNPNRKIIGHFPNMNTEMIYDFNLICKYNGMKTKDGIIRIERM